MSIDNPYTAPRSHVELPERHESRTAEVDATPGLLIFSWLFVVAVNTVIPFVFGNDVLRESGFVGACFAVLAVMAAGSGLAFSHGQRLRQVIIGAFLVGLSQLFPVIQVMAGVIAFTCVEKLGHATWQSTKLAPRVHSEVGGFIVAMGVALILIIASAAIGIVIDRFMTPRRSIRGLSNETVRR